MFNFFEELFAPGRKHTAAEQKRLELSRVDLGIGDPARGPIDLTAGKVTLRRPPPGPGAPDGPGDVPPEPPPGGTRPGTVPGPPGTAEDAPRGPHG
ncbi:DUF6191 domain-containing protein [Streptomyces clavifer]|uniref:DUF6191 domain-containing protein n=1 Tax=Streptomyces clavifer TaxID=68188 RepID=UPI0036786C52